MRRIEPRRYNKAFDRGAIFGKMLERYYESKLVNGYDKMFPFQLIEEHVEKSELSPEDKRLLSRVFLQYLGHYKKEEWLPVATELPFSVILYEDDKYIFVYEGTIDLLIVNPLNLEGYSNVDHKTYSMASQIYPYNNQAIGYCYVMKTDMFIYNYIGLTETKKPADNFQRDVKRFKKQDFESWLAITLKWFKRIADDEDYDKSYQCTSKYGTCSYHELCESPFASMREHLITTKFQHNSYASWGKEASNEKFVQIGSI